jgi:hypothetical protein
MLQGNLPLKAGPASPNYINQRFTSNITIRQFPAMNTNCYVSRKFTAKSWGRTFHIALRTPYFYFSPKIAAINEQRACPRGLCRKRNREGSEGPLPGRLLYQESAANDNKENKQHKNCSRAHKSSAECRHAKHLHSRCKAIKTAYSRNLNQLFYTTKERLMITKRMNNTKIAPTEV